VFGNENRGIAPGGISSWPRGSGREKKNRRPNIDDNRGSIRRLVTIDKEPRSGEGGEKIHLGEISGGWALTQGGSREENSRERDLGR